MISQDNGPSNTCFKKTNKTGLCTNATQLVINVSIKMMKMNTNFYLNVLMSEIANIRTVSGLFK